MSEKSPVMVKMLLEARADTNLVDEVFKSFFKLKFMIFRVGFVVPSACGL